MPEHILSFEAALAVVLEAAAAAPATTPETLPLPFATGRILAAPLLADRDQPPFDRATRDGFAVLSAAGSTPRHLRGEVRAGDRWSGPPLTGTDAVEIMTGAPVPPGADAILMVEHVTTTAEQLHIPPDRTPAAGQHIVPRGAELRAGSVALSPGTRLRAAEIGAAASLGAATVSVHRRPRVAILATGDELVELDQTPDPHQIRNSNTYALATLVSTAGGDPIPLPIARDTRDSLAEALTRARREADLLLLSGGVSAGKYDLVELLLAEAGATFAFTGVRMQPGKPLVFGSLPALDGPGTTPRLPFFGLPGNPVSTQVTFHCFVAPLLRALAGETDIARRFLLAALAQPSPGGRGLTRILPAHLSTAPPASLFSPIVTLVPWQGSGDQAANTRANCYAVLAPDRDTLPAGELIPILLR